MYILDNVAFKNLWATVAVQSVGVAQNQTSKSNIGSYCDKSFNNFLSEPSIL
jgi:hypothetical protein